MKRIYLVRHGETKANLHLYVPGKEEPLNSAGFKQADVLSQRVGQLDFDIIITSDFLRAKQTVKPILEIKKQIVEIMPDFGEMFEPTSLHGLFDNDEKVVNYRQGRNANVENTTWRKEDGENFSDLFTRIGNAKKILEENEHNNILVVSHSYFLQMFVSAILLDISRPSSSWLRAGVTLKMSNTGINLLTEENGLWRVVTWNDHAYFAE